MSLTYDDLVQKVRAAWESRIILTAVELGVSDAIGSDQLNAPDVADRLGADKRGVELLLNALVALDLLEKSDGLYRNSDVALEHLVKASPNYCGAGLMHHAHLWKSWTNLTEAVRTGEPPLREGGRSDDQYHDFVRAMYDFAWQRALALAGELDLTSVKSMLDLGGGPGSYAIAFCMENPEMEAIVFDKPLALDVAAEIVKKHGMEKRIELVPGDFLVDDIGEGFDLVLISQIIHSFNESDNKLIFKKAFDALKRGGRLMLQDFLLEPDRTAPAPAAVFAINMLVNTDGGRTYTWDEVESWIKESGFKDIERKATKGKPGIIIAAKS